MKNANITTASKANAVARSGNDRAGLSSCGSTNIFTTHGGVSCILPVETSLNLSLKRSVFSPCGSVLVSTVNDAEKTSPASMSPMKLSEGRILICSQGSQGKTLTVLTGFSMPFATSNSILTFRMNRDAGAGNRTRSTVRNCHLDFFRIAG